MTASNDLERLQRLLSDASEALLGPLLRRLGPAQPPAACDGAAPRAEHPRAARRDAAHGRRDHRDAVPGHGLAADHPHQHAAAQLRRPARRRGDGRRRGRHRRRRDRAAATQPRAPGRDGRRVHRAVLTLPPFKKTGIHPKSTRYLEPDMHSILAVDDSASMRQMVSFTLKNSGYDVIEAVDGMDGLDKAKAKSVNLVLTDQNMPRMDGLTLIKNLRGMSQYKTTPILMLTTEASDTMKQQGRAAGATGWLVKPFDPQKLMDVVRKVIG